MSNCFKLILNLSFIFTLGCGFILINPTESYAKNKKYIMCHRHAPKGMRHSTWHCHQTKNPYLTHGLPGVPLGTPRYDDFPTYNPPTPNPTPTPIPTPIPEPTPTPRPGQFFNVGRAPYALQSETFDCQGFLNSLNGIENLHIAFVWNTFGLNNDCLLSLMNDPRLKSLEIHLMNECCHRRGDCPPHEFLARINTPATYNKLLLAKDTALTIQLQEYMAPIRQFLDANLKPGTRCFISPGLESNISSEAMGWLNQITGSMFPNCALVQSGGGVPNNTNYDEGHGSSPNLNPPCFANLDGTDVDFPQRRTIDPNNHIDSKNLSKYIKKYAPKCEVVFLWTQDDNCKYSLSHFATNQRERVCKPTVVNQLLANEILRAQIGY
jgi:hypothetical protein